MLNLKADYGAVGNGTADDTTAISNWIAAMVSTGTSGFVPKGTYKCTSRMLFNMPGNNGNSVIIYGEGAYKSVFDLSSAPTTSGPQVHFYTGSSLPTSCYPHVQDVGFTSDTPNTLCAVGLEDFSDDIGNANFVDVFFGNANSTNSSSATCLQLNFVFDSLFQNVVCVGKVGYGTALDLRAPRFCTFTGGSYSNASTGIQLRHTNDSLHSAICNTFTGADIENVNYGVTCSEAYAEQNIFINTYMDIWRPDLTPASNGTGYAISSTNAGAKGLIFDQVYLNRGPSPLVDPNNKVNVYVRPKGGAESKHSFNVYHNSAGQSLATGWHKVSFDTEEYDTAGEISSSSHTIATAGVYHYGAGVNLTTTQANKVYITSIYVNGGERVRGEETDFTTGVGTTLVSRDVKLNTGDVVEIYQYNGGTTGVAVGYGGIPQATYFSGHLVEAV